MVATASPYFDTSATRLAHLRRFCEDIVPFFAVAAGVITVARLLLGVQNSQGSAQLILGFGPWYAAYVGALITLGPPMLAAFGMQWALHGRMAEPRWSLATLLIAWVFWTLLFMDRWAVLVVGPDFVPANAWASLTLFLLTVIGWFAWLIIRAALIRLRPHPMTLPLWRWAWFLALIPVVYHVGILSAHVLTQAFPGAAGLQGLPSSLWVQGAASLVALSFVGFVALRLTKKL